MPWYCQELYLAPHHLRCVQVGDDEAVGLTGPMQLLKVQRGEGQQQLVQRHQGATSHARHRRGGNGSLRLTFH